LAPLISRVMDSARVKRNSASEPDGAVSARVSIGKPLDAERRSARSDFPVKQKQNERRAP